MKCVIHCVYMAVRRLLRFFQRNVSPSLACMVQNLFSICIGSRSRFSFNVEERLYCATDGNLKRYFGEMNRGFSSYERGVRQRGKLLFESYCLQHVVFSEDDVVVDCGANYGDLFIELSPYVDESNYITFEPGPVEHQCLQTNIPRAKHYNLGLSNKTGVVNFYLSSDSADSSIVKPKFYSDQVNIKVTTLDRFMENINLKKCRLLKLEAEGWEPEILEGAESFLKLCDFVAIDGGPERGEECKLTFPDLDNKLHLLGFQMVDLVGARHRSLYKRIDL